LEDLSIIDVSAVRSVKYAHDLELKRKKQAEILIPDRLSYSGVIDIICFSDVKKLEILNILQKSGTKTSVIVNQGWYFMPRTHRG
jgi:hypothetical protein